MKKTVSILTLMALILLVTVAADAQTNLKIRLSGNTTRFLGEPNGDELPWENFGNFNNDTTNSKFPFNDFEHQGKLGFEAELMFALTEKAWLGFEIGRSNFNGQNTNPPMYNMFYEPLEFYPRFKPKVSDTWQPLTLDQKDAQGQYVPHSLKYATSTINVLANLRFYLATERFRPFVKLHSGVSFIGTELAFFNQTGAWLPESLEINGVPQNLAEFDFDPVVYSRGTSSSEEGRWPALNVGAGLGFEYQINQKISLYADYTYSMINSDIVDGRPNYDGDKAYPLNPPKRFNT